MNFLNGFNCGGNGSDDDIFPEEKKGSEPTSYFDAFMKNPYEEEPSSESNAVTVHLYQTMSTEDFKKHFPDKEMSNKKKRMQCYKNHVTSCLKEKKQFFCNKLDAILLPNAPEISANQKTIHITFNTKDAAFDFTTSAYNPTFQSSEKEKSAQPTLVAPIEVSEKPKVTIEKAQAYEFDEEKKETKEIEGYGYIPNIEWGNEKNNNCKIF